VATAKLEEREEESEASLRLIGLSSTTSGEFKLWDSWRQESINPVDEGA
jgi:hypothetical protein